MSKLIYIRNVSLDGHEDANGAFDFANPDQVHAFITELIRPIGTHLYGRRLYQTMAVGGHDRNGAPGGHANARRDLPGQRTRHNAVQEMSRPVRLAAVLALCVVLGPTLSGHHSQSEYDLRAKVAVEGTITKVERARLK